MARVKKVYCSSSIEEQPQHNNTESSSTSDLLVQAAAENLKIWKKVPIISDKYSSAKHNSRTWDLAVFTPRKQLGLYEMQKACVLGARAVVA